MTRTAILIGPSGIGKSAAADALKSLLKCTGILDNWDGLSLPSSPGLLLITSAPHLTTPKPAADERTFQVQSSQALQQLLHDLQYQVLLSDAISGRP